MIFIPATTIAEAWLRASQHLLGCEESDWRDTTVVLHIAQPSLVRKQDREVAEALDRFLEAHGQQSNHTIAETIFPGAEYLRNGVEGVFQRYPDEIYPRLEKLKEVRWGTYAHRLLRRVDSKGRTFNPLEDCIGRMKQKQPVHAAYEVGLGLELELGTYDDDIDRSRRMGGPCLSHLSFKLIKNVVHLTAIYRSHHYVKKAYGNLLGLARLQAFVATQVGATCGPLVCHSTLALLDHDKDWGKTEVRALFAGWAKYSETQQESFALA